MFIDLLVSVRIQPFFLHMKSPNVSHENRTYLLINCQCGSILQQWDLSTLATM